MARPASDAPNPGMALAMCSMIATLSPCYNFLEQQPTIAAKSDLKLEASVVSAGIYSQLVSPNACSIFARFFASFATRSQFPG